MKEQKNIERLFQENFKDFEAQPPQDAWKNIEDRLNEKKKKRRIVPFWWRVGGVAATLLLGIGLYWNFQSSEIAVGNSQENNVVLDKNQNNPLDRERSVPMNENNSFDKNSNFNQTEIADGKNSDELEKTKNKQNEAERLANSEKENSYSNENSNLKNNVFEKQKSNKTIAEQTGKNEKVINFQNNQNAFSSENKEKTNDDSKKSLLAENKTIAKDSSQVVDSEKPENELEKLLKEKEEGKNADEKEEEKRSKWAVSTNAAPVYFNSFTNGSPLDEQFASNSKSYETSLSYGVGLAYNISSRFSVKTGINNVALKYETENVYYSSLISESGSNARINSLNVNRNASSKNVYLYNKVSTSKFDEVDNFTNTNTGNISQEFGYFEIPVELSYKVIDKKIGISVISGLSTFLLNNNSVSLVDGHGEMSLGKANNLNDVSFSGNFGLGVNYNFWKSFNANVQPTLKYQFNTFSENSGDFKPYFIGVYTGISYSF